MANPLFLIQYRVSRFEIRNMRFAKRDIEVLGLMRPQDVLILSKLFVQGARPWRVIDLAYELGISQSEVSEGLNRCRRNGLVADDKRDLLKTNLLEFLVHGIQYVFPAQLGGLCMGVSTGFSLRKAEESPGDPLVWPSAKGSVRGLEIKPLVKSVPFAVANDPALHRFLALVDALRCRELPERVMAAEAIQEWMTKGELGTTSLPSLNVEQNPCH